MSDQKTWWDYFDEDPYEKVGREVEGLFGSKITVVLNRYDWAYLDWVEKELHANVKKSFRQIDRVRRQDDPSRDDMIASNIRLNFLNFEKQGKPRPPWCEPANPQEFHELDDVEIRDW